MTVHPSFELALQHHQSGRLAEAEALYREILAAQPDDAEALHMLGLLSHQSGRHEAAEELIGKAIALMPENAGCHSNLCDVLRLRGRFDEAVAAGRRAVELRPDSATAHNNLGNVFSDMGRPGEAIAAYGRTLELTPHDADVCRNLGNVLKGEGRIGEAIAAFGTAAALDPDNAGTLNVLGGMLRDRGRTEEATAVLRRAVQLKPRFAEARYNLGNALRDAGQMEEAAAEYRTAIALRPDFAEAHNNLGNLLADLDRPDEAEAAYRKALDLRPDYVNALHNLGKFLGEQGRREEAMASCRRAIEIDPGHARSRLNLATLHLLGGDFAQGWPLYEARWDAEDFTSPKRNFSQPMWDGSPLDGQRVLLHAEQGFGDSIQFIRYAPLVAERGGSVVVECSQPLAELFATVRGVSKVVTSGDPLPPFDLHVPMLSLPLVFGMTLENIPQGVPYLAADPARCQFWRERLGEDRSRLKIGIVWAGRPTHSRDRMRSIPLQRLLPLLRVQGVDFISLQMDDRTAQIRQLPGASGVLDPSGDIGKFADTATLLSQLDLVIAVDTAVAHLAGALGRPVWTLLPFAPDWRWLLGREDSPWYPTMRLFRQPRIMDWDPVIEKVREELQALVQSHD